MSRPYEKYKPVKQTYKGIEFRSKNESRFAEWLDEHKQEWVYEPECFRCDDIFYLPDFYLPKPKILVEVKPVIFSHELAKLDAVLNHPQLEDIRVLVVTMTPKIQVLEFSEDKARTSIPGDDGDDGRHLMPSEDMHGFGFCVKCHSLHFYGYGSWSCGACGYYDGDQTLEYFDSTHYEWRPA